MAAGWAILAAVFLGGNAATVRRGLVMGSVYLGVLSSLLLGIPMFAAVAFFTGEIGLILDLSPEAWFLLGLAGIVHFVIGRTLIYRTIQLLGSNRATPIIASQTIYTVAMGAVFLSEPLTLGIVLGTGLIFTGLILVSRRKDEVLDLRPGPRGVYSRGVIVGVAASVVVSIPPLLVRLGVTKAGSPSIGILISYLFATAIYAPLLLRERTRAGVFRTRPHVIFFMSLAAVLANLGNLIRYVALQQAGVSIVAPLSQTHPLFAVLFAYLMNRRGEDFTGSVIVGAALIVAGINMVYLLV